MIFFLANQKMEKLRGEMLKKKKNQLLSITDKGGSQQLKKEMADLVCGQTPTTN